VTALTQPLPELVAPAVEQVEQVDTLVVVVVVVAVARNATSVARSVISHVTALKVVALMVEVIKAIRADMVVGTVVDAKVVRLATLVADTDTCRVTVPKGRNATTVGYPFCLPSPAILTRFLRWRGWSLEPRLPL